jgi:hypothetical protein
MSRLSLLCWAVLSSVVYCAIAPSSACSQEPLDSKVRFASAASSLKTATVAGQDSISGISNWPYQHCVGQFHLHSTVPIALLEKQLASVMTLPAEICEQLQVAIASDRIDIVILESREALDSYARRFLPNTPSRRALYFRHRGPGLVMTYYHPGWIHDARHECTHALLDASEIALPLWQDEGLAEYFETPGDRPVDRSTHFSPVRSQVRYGQIPDLVKLESLDSRDGLDPKEYRDAWSVIAFLLHSSAPTRRAYQEYLQDLQAKRVAGFLSHRLTPTIESWRVAFSDFYRR